MATVTTQAIAYQLSDFQVWNSTANTWSTATTYGQITYSSAGSKWRLKAGAVAKVAHITDDDPYLNDSSAGASDPHPEVTSYIQTVEIKNAAGATVLTSRTFSADSAAVDIRVATDTTGSGADADNFTYAKSEMDAYHLVYNWGGANSSNWFVFSNGSPQPGMVYYTGAFNGTVSDNDATDTVFGGNWGNDITVVGATISGLTCFVTGTMIETAAGLRPVETIRLGDLVRTKDSGFKPVMWVGHRTIPLWMDEDAAKHYPVRIRAGALGKNIPSTDLYVSPQHRVLLKSKIAERLCGADEILVAAKKLVGLEGVEIVTDCEEVTYLHFLFDRHEIVYSNGAETESLYTGPEALKSVGSEARTEIMALFPELADLDYQAQIARITPPGKMIRKLVERHMSNGQCVYSAH